MAGAPLASAPLLWRGCEWEGYRASPDGTIFGKRTGAALRPGKSTTGYLYVSLRGDRGRFSAKIHQIIAETFIGPRPAGTEVAHSDGNPLNNAVKNLRYATRTENAADSVRHGTVMRGEKHCFAKLTEALVVEIRARLRTGEKQRVLADAFGVARATISDIAVGRTWCAPAQLWQAVA